MCTIGGVSARFSSYKVGRRLWQFLAVCAAVIAVFIAMFPLYWAVAISLKPRDVPMTGFLLPGVTFAPSLNAWRGLFEIPDLGSSLWNSVFISVGGATLAVALAAPAAYALARRPFPYRWAAGMLLGFLLLRLVPPVVYLPAYLLLMRQLGLIDTILALVLVNATINLPLAAIILTGAFREIPREIEEASWVDGVGRWGSFARICVPLAAPALAASWLLCLAFIWNEWMYASAIGYVEAKSFPVLIQATGGGGGVNFGAATTRALAATAVPVVAALLAQRYMVRALSLGAVKG